ncbi:MAG: TetR/AcrR family transcriptional regulator [Candidatus Margulisbacteria bacterium]|nr:TetR/AcrR family transcriptional regulator [Candidatus Margulisiibacteriota bacterium]
MVNNNISGYTTDSQTENKILRSALNVFVNKGWHGASMQEIADNAGVNKALLHYYFRTKQNLYEKIFEFIIAKNFQQLNDCLNENGNFYDILSNFVDRYINIFADNSKLSLFIMRDFIYGGNIITKEFKKLADTPTGLPPQKFMRITEKAKARGEIKDVNSFQLLLTILGACIYSFFAEPLIKEIMPLKPEINSKEFLKERKRSIVETIYNGIRKDKK